jgi:hypothetical protein
MKFILALTICFISATSYSQSYSEIEIKKLAGQVNKQIKGVDLGNGIRAKGCLSLGRTLIYQYDVPEHWEAPYNIKEEIIANLKTSGTAKTYFLNNIDVVFYYYKGNSLIKKVSVKSNEFSTFNFKLGEYISIKDHPKSKDVNLKIKAPVGWEVKEGNMPNIVMKFTHGRNTYMILIQENITFFSRNQMRETLQEGDFIEEYIKALFNDETSFLKKPQLINQSVVTVNNYPSIQFKAKGQKEHLGLTFDAAIQCWVVFYEDKIINLQAWGLDNQEFKALEQVFLLITNSVIFPEQFD